MGTFLSMVALGFFLGMRHATDADHVIAVATIVSRERKMGAASLIGALWGIGHTLTVLLVGGAIILLGVVIPPRVGLAMEFAVGVMLVILGVLTLAGAARRVRETAAAYADAIAQGHAHVHRQDAHVHAHAHGDYAHTHTHGHDGSSHGHGDDQTPQAWLDRHFGSIGLYQAVRPIVVGVVHGLAGSAAVALMVLAAIRDPWWAVIYLLVFGLGTIAGMMLITAVIAAPFAYSSGRLPNINTFMRVAAGVLSLIFGLYLMFQIGFVDGLFSADPGSDSTMR